MNQDDAIYYAELAHRIGYDVGTKTTRQYGRGAAAQIVDQVRDTSDERLQPHQDHPAIIEAFNKGYEAAVKLSDARETSLEAFRKWHTAWSNYEPSEAIKDTIE